jgi:hypothetical protein
LTRQSFIDTLYIPNIKYKPTKIELLSFRTCRKAPLPQEIETNNSILQLQS